MSQPETCLSTSLTQTPTPPQPEPDPKLIPGMCIRGGTGVSPDPALFSSSPNQPGQAQQGKGWAAQQSC